MRGYSGAKHQLGVGVGYSTVFRLTLFPIEFAVLAVLVIPLAGPRRQIMNARPALSFSPCLFLFFLVISCFIARRVFFFFFFELLIISFISSPYHHIIIPDFCVGLLYLYANVNGGIVGFVLSLLACLLCEVGEVVVSWSSGCLASMCVAFVNIGIMFAMDSLGICDSLSIYISTTVFRS